MFRIDGEVEKVKEIVDNTRRFVNEVQAIRNVSGNDFANKVIQKAYYEVDQPFEIG